MSISTTFNESTLSAIQNYALSANPEEFLNSLPEGLEKNILKALTLPYQSNLQEELIRAGVPTFLANQIVQTKTYDRIQSASSIGEIQQIVDDLRKTYANQLFFAKPFQSRKKQIRKQVEGVQQIVQARFPSKLQTENPKDLQTYFLDLLKKNQKDISQMEIFGLRNLPQATLLNLSVEKKSRIISMPGLLPSFTSEFASKFIRKYQAQMTEKQLIKFTVSEYVYRSLPIGHINKLAEDDPELMISHQFLKVWFTSNFEKRYPLLTKNNSLISFTEKQGKRKLIQQVVLEVKKVTKNIYREYILKQLQLQLLALDLALEDPSLERFVSYLSTVNENLTMFNRTWSELTKVQGAFNARILSNLETTSMNFNMFGEEYIQAILKKYNSEKYSLIDKQLLEIFDERWYKRLKSKILLAKGDGDLEKILTEDQKLAIRQKKELTICKSNKGSFKVEEDVILKIKVKNISKITVKIYEMNLEKHYIQRKGQIQDDMDLHFLDPTYQFLYEIENKDPFKEQIYDMTLKQVKKEKGVYIVDLDAAGISSRAVIRKGSIFCLTRVTLAGVELKFYDQSGKIIEELNMWLRGQLIPVKGSYIIPFGNSSESLEIIAVVGQYAQTLSINIPSESYTLKVTPYVNNQSLIVGSKAKIILNPRLVLIQQDRSCVQTPISLKLLKNISIQATMIDQENVKSVVSFENVKWSYAEDYVIQIPVQTYLRYINVSGSAEITKYNGEKQSLGFNTNIAINFSSSSDEIVDCYLKKVGENYVIFVLGLDGQPIARAHVPVHIKSKWFSQFKAHDFESDHKGQVNLGPLHYAQVVMIQRFAKEWWIGSLPGTSQLFKRMCFREGEKIKIPLPPTNHKIQIGTDANFYSMEKETILENLNQLLSINDKFLQIPGLSTGRYSLTIFSINYSGTIVVVKGTQWENPNQIYNEDTATVYEFIRNSNYYLTLGDTKIEQLETGNKVTMEIIKPEGVQINQDVKVHVMAYSFIPNRTCRGSVIEISQNDAKYTKFIPKGSSYLCNKKLSEEATYVLNRKDQAKFVGNNLEKPHILLKRIKIRDTVQKQEQMKKQQAFSDRRQNVVDLLDDLGDNFNFNSNNNNNNSRSSQAVTSVQPKLQDLSLHNNFLQQAGIILSNFKTEKIEFVLPNCYSFFTVFLLSNNSEMVRNYVVEKSELATKRLTHVGLPKETNEKAAWSMSRQAYPIGVNECRKISRTSQWCAISLASILRYAKAQGAQLDQWVERWSSYTWDFKLQIYNRKACHELNTYIKHHDPEFFNKVVSPFISNKINKRFVDMCLLQDSACEEWVPLQFFNQLNEFEKVLLVEYLAKKGKFKEAESLANGMELRSRVDKFNYSSFKQKFEALLNIDSEAARPSIPPPPPQPKMQQNRSIPPPPPPPPCYGAPPPSGRAALNNLFGFSGTTATTTTSTASVYSSSSFGASGAGLFGGPPPPPPPMAMPMAMPMMARYAPPQYPGIQSNMQFQKPSEMLEQSLIDRRGTYVQQFKEVQNTSEYAEVTYDGVRDSSSNLTVPVPQAKFWADLACHLARGRNNGNFNQQTFINQSIMYLTGKLSFTLAACFLPKNLNPDYEISSEGSSLLLTGNKPFLLLIKQIKAIPFNPKSGLIMNHRFVDPKDMYTYEEDGSRMEKEVDQFVYGKQYSLQTLVTNISSNSLQIQLLVDLPQGAIPLKTKEYTQVSTAIVSAYSTQSFARSFYFPREGKFELLPANACWVKDVIAKAAAVPTIQVKAKKTSKKIETFKDMLEEGETEDIVSYLQTKNIFDQNLFKPHDILWMLSDKQKFEKIVEILRNRGYVNRNVWMFGLLHGNLEVVKQLMSLIKNKGPKSEILGEPLKVLEYYPYYSSRTHKYQNANKAKIRNVEFKETYYRFLLDEIVFANKKKKANFQLGAAYYLLLQDRIDEASNLIKSYSGQTGPYKLQFDYIQCFLDMYEGFPNFGKARKIVQDYREYPISSWRVLFEEIEKTLRNYDTAVYTEEEEKKIEYRTIITKEDEILRISLPENQRVQILLHSVNLQLLFSENPFQQIKECTSIRPAKVIIYEPGQSRQERLKRPDDLKDVIVEVYESGKSTYLRKVDSFLWQNPKLKVKGNQKTGSLQVFYQNKPVSGTYCKVYSTGSNGVKFYRDGYTDITGSFKYALSELSQINRFSVLCMSDNGGRICNFGKPTEAGQLLQL